MTLLFPIILVLLGFLLLIWSADLLVDNASVLADRLGVSAFLIGILIIGFGTSAPEMFVSAMAALEDKGNLALGNALGSNITNIGLVLGCAALIKPLNIAKNTCIKDIPMIIITGLIAVSLIAFDAELSRIDGVILLSVLFAYLFWTSKNAASTDIIDFTDKLHEHDLAKNAHPKAKSTIAALALSILSIVLLVTASKMLVHGAIEIAVYLNINELLIGLTIVAIGTSLPELAAAVAAARKSKHDMIIGNIIGSNVFNTLGVLGITGTIQTTNIELSAISRDFPMMFFLSILMLVFALSKSQFSRPKGAILLISYLVYICYLAMVAIQ